MLFARRNRPPLVERVCALVWPRRNWSRSLRYAKLRFGRLQGAPHVLALGLGIGVFTSFQPILGAQMVLAGAVAWLLGASVAAAFIGTFVGTPVTWPFMWLASYHLGAVIIGEDRSVCVAELWAALIGLGAAASPGGIDPTGQGNVVWQLLWPLTVGAVPLGLLAGAAIYAIVMRAATLKQR